MCLALISRMNFEDALTCDELSSREVATNPRNYGDSAAGNPGCARAASQDLDHSRRCTSPTAIECSPRAFKRPALLHERRCR
jgi:hypothetical protein